ncbi:MAG: OmpA family protein [Bdellovibrionales bacterium]|nr:OmpA family protein [Bdellovibrionales bacterium]
MRTLRFLLLSLAVVVLTTGCATMKDTTKMKADIDKAAAPDFGPFMQHLVLANHNLAIADGIYSNMTEDKGTFGHKERFQEAGEHYAALAADERMEAEAALQRILDKRLLHLERLHVPKAVGMSTFTLYFGLGSSSLRAASNKSIREAADLLKQYPLSQVAIIGYTDTLSSDSYNKRLAQRRAMAAYSALKALGVPRRALDTAGLEIVAHGEVGDPDNTANQENRRVEIRIQPHSNLLYQGE